MKLLPTLLLLIVLGGCAEHLDGRYELVDATSGMPAYFDFQEDSVTLPGRDDPFSCPYRVRGKQVEVHVPILDGVRQLHLTIESEDVIIYNGSRYVKRT